MYAMVSMITAMHRSIKLMLEGCSKTTECFTVTVKRSSWDFLVYLLHWDQMSPVCAKNKIGLPFSKTVKDLKVYGQFVCLVTFRKAFPLTV